MCRDLIRPCREDFCPKINSRACTAIRILRVLLEIDMLQAKSYLDSRIIRIFRNVDRQTLSEYAKFNSPHCYFVLSRKECRFTLFFQSKQFFECTTFLRSLTQILRSSQYLTPFPQNVFKFILSWTSNFKQLGKHFKNNLLQRFLFHFTSQLSFVCIIFGLFLHFFHKLNNIIIE